jgi:type II secretory pathway component HofQ
VWRLELRASVAARRVATGIFCARRLAVAAATKNQSGHATRLEQAQKAKEPKSEEQSSPLKPTNDLLFITLLWYLFFFIFNKKT